MRKVEIEALGVEYVEKNESQVFISVITDDTNTSWYVHNAENSLEAQWQASRYGTVVMISNLADVLLKLKESLDGGELLFDPPPTPTPLM